MISRSPSSAFRDGRQLPGAADGHERGEVFAVGGEVGLGMEDGHGGGCGSGAARWSFTLTDFRSGWTELAALRGNSGGEVRGGSGTWP